MPPAPPPTPPAVSDAELAVLKILWTHGPATVRDVEKHLARRKKWAYNTILTLLSRLRDKGCVAQDRAADAHVFRAAISRDQFLGHRLRELACRIFDGNAAPALVHLIHQTRDQLSPLQLQELRDLLNRKDKP